MFQNYYTFIFIILLILGIYLFLNGLLLFSKNIKLYKNLSFFNNINNSNRLLIILYGFLFSSIIQSTSICISIIIPLIGIGLLSIKSCFLLTIGFNIGTVSSLFFTGLNTRFCSLLLLISSLFFYIFYIIKRNNKFFLFSNLLFGLMLIFLGLSIIKTSFIFFKTTSLYLFLLNNITKSYFSAFFTGFILSAIIQSGSIISTTFQLLYINSDIKLIFIIFIILGSNLGSTITGILASLYYNAEAKLVAYFNVLLNLIGILFTLTVFTYFLNCIFYITSCFNQQRGFEIPIAHLLFNVFSAVIILPFLNFIQKTLFIYTK